MGTAKTNSGPKTAAWAKAKRRATTWAGSADSASSGVRGVVAAAAAALLAGDDGILSPSGVSSVQRLGGLLTGFSAVGVAPTLESYGLGHLVGLTTDELLIALTNYIAGDDAGFEQEAIRAATDAMFAAAVDEMPTDPEGVWDEAAVRMLLTLFWTVYITSLIVQALDDSLMKAAPSEAERRRAEITAHVGALLEHHLEERSVTDLDWTGTEGSDLASRIRSEVLYVVSGETPDGESQ